MYGKPYKAATASVDPAVPLKLTEYIEDKKYIRNSVQEVYEQVLDDLNEAEKSLSEVAPKSIYRANLTAVYLLQSRGAFFIWNWGPAGFFSRE